MKIAIIVSVVIGIITAVLAEAIMRICNHQDDTLDLSVSFFRIIMGFMFFQAVSTVLNASLRGIGKTKVTLVSNVAMGITDILFNYLLIEGRLGFPRLEIRGDAIATVLGSISACIISIIVICSQNDFIHLKGFFTEKGFSDRERLRIIFNKAGNMEPDLLFTEEVLVKKEYTDIPGIPEKLRVINRYRYSENDTLVLKDYRIAAT